MRAAALDIARRLPAKTPGRAQIMRRIARDAIFTDPRASLEFFAFEALGAASDPGIDSQSAADAVAMIAAEAAALDTFQYSSESWRACADFLLSQQQPRAASEFLRACLEDPSKRGEEEIALLARAAVACDAIVGGRAGESLALAGRLRGLGHHPFGNSDRPGSETDVLSGILSLLGDSAGAELVLEAGLAVDPADGALLNNLGFARLERGLADARTEQLLEQAVRLRPSDSGTLDSIGWLRYLQGRLVDADGVPGAISLLERSVASQGKAPSAVKYDHLGDARWRAGDHEGARQAWADAVRIAEGGLAPEQTIELLRVMFRKQFGLGAIDAARYYNAHDGQVAARARGKIEAVAKGVEPEVAATPATTPTNPPELRKQ
jgi:tetratricopeptide (TPR) repeat protein